ncbi:hypothetical protein TDB9533_03530 [Thalassocella blandensis]|nr:hypothetical protein TDB9533_03530 [Thalassocella blandensis]
MTNLSHLYIAAVGILTPLGDSVSTCSAAIRAGVSRYGDIGYFNRRDYPMKGCYIPAEVLPKLEDSLIAPGIVTRERRLARIAAPALQKVLGAVEHEAPLPLFLAGPDTLPGPVKSINGNIIKYIQTQAGIELDLARTRYFASGRSGVIEALDLAFKFFESFNEDYVLVGGLDTYLDPTLLSVLDSEGRVLAENSQRGFAVSEGACFLMLTPKQELASNSIRICKPGMSREEGHMYSEHPYMGEALSQAVAGAMQNANSTGCTALYSAMNGEDFFAKEYGVAVIRNKKYFAEDFEHFHPADCYGDVGAASGAVLVAYAADELSLSEKIAPALVCTSSDLGRRSAVCLC